MSLEFRGFTNWRNTPEVQTHVTLTPEQAGLLPYFITSDLRWATSDEPWALETQRVFGEIYGQEALAKAKNDLQIPESTDPVFVNHFAFTPEFAAQLKAAGQIFGHDPIWVEVDHTGEHQVITPFGPVWVKD
jgi:hypothetical protein